MSLSEANKMRERAPQLNGAHIQRAVLLRTLWYSDIVDALVKSARDYLLAAGVRADAIEVREVPGSFELPLAALRVAREKRCDMIVALGCVIQGDTPHFEYVCQGLVQGLMDVQLRENVPVGMGVLTVSNLPQALERREKGAEAAQAALQMAVTFSDRL